MKNKLNTILLIDDREEDNFYHQVIIEDAGITKNIVVCDSCEAIEYLSKMKKSVPTNPAIIFLDINMPKINGWEFLDQYEHFDCFGEAVIVILSNSLSPFEIEKAKCKLCINEYKNKPITKPMLEEILEKYFYKNGNRKQEKIHL